MTPAEALEKGYLLIVPNQRMAQYWTDFWVSKQNVVQGDCALSFQGLLRSFWKKTEDQLLDEAQAVLWIAQSVLYDSMPLETKVIKAQKYYQAYTRLKRWQCSADQAALFFPNPAQKTFLSFVSLLENKKKQYQIVFIEDLAQRALQIAWPEGLDKPLYWCGFDDPTPLQKAFFEHTCQNNPETLWEPTFEKTLCPAQKTIYPSEDEEFHAALKWLSQQPQNERCAIVMPDLQERYRHWKQLARQYFDPDLAILPLDQTSRRYSFSHGLPLSKVAPIQPLLEHWEDQLQKISEDSKYCATPTEHVFFLGGDSLGRLSEWLQRLLRLLEKEQWLEQRELSSQEYQAAQMFWGHCESLFALSSLLDPLSEKDFFYFLRASLDLKLFQSQSLQKNHMILGLLEASALPWDRIWIVHADRSRFPPLLQPSALLPYYLQEQYDFPHSSYAREERYLKALLQRLSSQAKQISCSIPQYLSSGLLSTPSYIIDSCFKGSYDPFLIEEQEPVERWPFEADPSPKKPHTLSLSQLESIQRCFFQGWAALLPGASPDERHTALFDPRAYGSFVHQAIENKLLYDRWDAARPKAWTEELTTIVYKQLEPHADKLYDWFLSSGQQFVCEQSILYDFEGFSIRGRIDLFDSKNGKIVDIKTKKTSLSQWAAPNPSSWQGPVYALATQSSSIGILSFFEGQIVYQEQDSTQYQEAWIQALSLLLQKWRQGYFDPSPQNEQHCRHCVWKASCRYHWVPSSDHERGL